MKTRILLSMLMVCSVMGYAQEAIPAEKKVYDHDFGFNSLFILNGLFQSQSTPFSIMYKKYNDENKALRAGLDLSLGISNSDGEIPPGNSYSDMSNFDLALSIGKEFQHPFSGKWMWYYGGDVSPRIIRSRYEVFINDDKTRASTTSAYSLSLRPFIGIRFNINTRLYLSAEANASLAYSVQYALEKEFIPVETTTRDLTTTNLSFNLNPASGIFIFYRF